MKPNYQILLSKQDPTPYFNRWRGEPAAIWAYTVSHRILELRVQNEGKCEYLCIFCGDVQYIRGPMKWDNSSFEIERINADELILRDQQADFELRAGVLGVEEINEK